MEQLASEPLRDGLLLREPGFRVRCVTLDHGVPVLAFLLQLDDTRHVRPQALACRGLEPGAWLGELKRLLARGETRAPVTLPDGSREAAGSLGDALLDVEPGTRLAYATDLAVRPTAARSRASPRTPIC